MMGPSTLLTLVLTLGVFLTNSKVSGDGALWLKFVQYINPKGQETSGSYCDGKWGFRTSDCDHYFILCLDEISSPNDTYPCKINKTETGVYKDMNSIVFHTDVGGLPNPSIWHMKPLLTTMSIKVAVYDKDSKNDDWVDFLRLDLGKRPHDLDPGQWHTFNMTHRTTLEVRVRFVCTKDWYGKRCSILCRAPQRGQHYHCDKLSGAKVCERGWGGPTCSHEKSLCGPLSCQNGGTCLWTNNEEVCRCTKEFTGAKCEVDRCEEWCRPGTCGRWDSGRDGYMCSCPTGYQNHKSARGGSECRKETAPAGSTPTGSPGGGRQPLKDNSDCDTLANSGHRYRDGVYEIQPGNAKFKAYCDMSDSGNGWTEIMQRAGNDLDFYRKWSDYKTGFGEPGEEKDYWIGLENMHQLTSQRRYKLVIQMQTVNGEWHYARYDQFSVDTEADNYQLHLQGYSGTAGDAFGTQGLAVNIPFSTYDRDNDGWKEGKCARDYKCGWWFKFDHKNNHCSQVNLNGVFVRATNGWPRCNRELCIKWGTLQGYKDFSLLRASMKIHHTGP